MLTFLLAHRQDEDVQLVLNTVRCLAADLCQQVGLTKPVYIHPVLILKNCPPSSQVAIQEQSWERPVSLSPCGNSTCDTTLLTRLGSVETVSYHLPLLPHPVRNILNPLPPYPGFILSAGHACLLQYMFLHLSGYPQWTMEQLKMYHSKALEGSMTAGHPEIEYPGIEVTTGPLGQGISNAVGMAIAAKQLGATYNMEGFEVIGKRIWCFTGDGCLQEGVGQECECGVVISAQGDIELI